MSRWTAPTPSDVFGDIDAYGIRILDGDRVNYADAQGVESLTRAHMVDGSQMIDGVRFCAV
jgi:hypothetical protein